MSLEFSSSDGSPEFERVIAALDDGACREIIAVLEDPMTVDDIAEAADRPLSTTYRKLDCLTEAGLVEEAAGVREGRHQKARYVANLERVSIDLDDANELRAEIDHSTEHDFWSELSREF
ncbi:helix-turn-helix domain-containing protein [Natrinema sp. LN54]|uniref:helix-turn-helix domain-containing protein n=1 Tax=Natrinema sp. LN54 TaxID=3458705 RepID=UPI004037166D